MKVYHDETTGFITCEEHNEKGGIVSPEVVETWHKELKADLIENADERDYYPRPLLAWANDMAGIYCDHCGRRLDKKGRNAMELTATHVFDVRGHSAQGITYQQMIRADSAFDAEAEMALLLEIDGLTPGTITATEVAREEALALSDI